LVSNLGDSPVQCRDCSINLLLPVRRECFPEHPQLHEILALPSVERKILLGADEVGAGQQASRFWQRR